MTNQNCSQPNCHTVWAFCFNRLPSVSSPPQKCFNAPCPKTLEGLEGKVCYGKAGGGGGLGWKGGGLSMFGPVRLRSDSKVWSELAFGPVGHCFLCCNRFFPAVMWSLRFPFFWSSVCHYMRFTTIKTRPVNMFLNARQFDNVFLFRRPTRLKEEPTLQYVEEFIFSSERSQN